MTTEFKEDEKKQRIKGKNETHQESFMVVTFSLSRPHALLSLIPTQDSLGTTVYSDMWNSSHTSTQTQMHIPGPMVVISLALGAGMTS